MKNFRNKRLDYNVLSSARQRVKKKGMEFSISLNDIVIPDFCPILGIKIEKGVKERIDGSPFIDRIDNNKGYTKNNIVIISWRANKLKSDASMEELQKVIDFYKKYEK